MTKNITKSELDTIKNGIDHYFEVVQQKSIDAIDNCYELRSLDALKNAIDNYRKQEDTRQAMFYAFAIIRAAMGDKESGKEITVDWATAEAISTICINY